MSVARVIIAAMTDQDKRVQFGEVLVSIRETEKDLNHHIHRIHTIGAQLSELGVALENDRLTGLDPISQEKAMNAVDRQEIQETLKKIRELRTDLDRLKNLERNLS